MRWLLAPATITTLLLAIPSRGAGHVWLQNHPFDLPMTALVLAVTLIPAGLYLGWRKANVFIGLIGAVLIGSIAAASFFLTVSFAGESAVWASWLSAWLLLSALQSYLDGHFEAGRSLVRGVAAAAFGAIGLAIVMNVPVFPAFLAWILAYAPGATLLMRR